MVVCASNGAASGQNTKNSEVTNRFMRCGSSQQEDV
jgi:hypothetical protein